MGGVGVCHPDKAGDSAPLKSDAWSAKPVNS